MIGKYLRRKFANAAQINSPTWLILTLLRIKRDIRVSVFGEDIWIRTATPDLSVALSCLGGEFDKVFENAKSLKHNLIIDAGGYIGTAAIAFARRYPQATIVSLEPSPENYRMLQRNTRNFPNIIALNKALATKPGSLTLYDRGTGEWGFTIAHDAAATPVAEVECTTTEQVLDEIGHNGIDILKLDIEGGEYELLGDDLRWLDKADRVAIELHDRIVPGCTQRWSKAVANRNVMAMDGEKFLAIKRGVSVASAA